MSIFANNYPKDRKKMLKLFKRTRRLLATGDHAYICYTLEEAKTEILAEKGLNDWDNEALVWSRTVDHCSNYISNKLGSHTFYEAWVEEKHPEIYEKMMKKEIKLSKELPGYENEQERLRLSPFTKGRRQWLKAIIAKMEGV